MKEKFGFTTPASSFDRRNDLASKASEPRMQRSEEPRP